MKTYHEALHALQSGVAYEQTKDAGPTSGKHLRVGLDARASDQKGLVDLLIQKGVITADEYIAAVTKTLNEEVERYERLLLDIYGIRVKLV